MFMQKDTSFKVNRTRKSTAIVYLRIYIHFQDMSWSLLLVSVIDYEIQPIV